MIHMILVFLLPPFRHTTSADIDCGTDNALTTAGGLVELCLFDGAHHHGLDQDSLGPWTQLPTAGMGECSPVIHKPMLHLGEDPTNFCAMTYDGTVRILTTPLPPAGRTWLCG